MIRQALTLALALVLAGGMPAAATAQEATSPSPAPERNVPQEPAPSAQSLTPLTLQIVMSRQQDGKKVSSVPYVLSVNSDQQFSQLRMTTRVPVATGDEAAAEDSVPGKPVFIYEEVGTRIDCGARALHDGRYRVTISIDDSSVYVGKQAADGVKALAARPSFRSFKSTQHLILTDGQSTRYTVATDKISGEVIQVDVSLAVAGK